MTNTRLWFPQTDQWTHCPWCGAELSFDQDTKLIIRDSKDEIDYDASEKNGFSFTNSVSHCGYHIRLWVGEENPSESHFI